nr:hypothetical protein BCU37_07035 [Vibrio splendidus]PMK58941.1 hypothetical protein BCT96_16070 [Vibrio splendidus]
MVLDNGQRLFILKMRIHALNEMAEFGKGYTLKYWHHALLTESSTSKELEVRYERRKLLNVILTNH